MGLREGESERFPYEGGRDIQYVLVSWNGESFEVKGYGPGLGTKPGLIERLRSNKDPLVLLGIWKGRWTADPFLLDPKIALREMERLEEVPP